MERNESVKMMKFTQRSAHKSALSNESSLEPYVSIAGRSCCSAMPKAQMVVQRYAIGFGLKVSSTIALSYKTKRSFSVTLFLINFFGLDSISQRTETLAPVAVMRTR